jgi:transcriptional regulator with XRE-family HTH domain
VKDLYLQEWLLAPDGIATRLRKLRDARTGRDFAQAAGMRAAKLSKLELAQQVPTEDDIRRIVDAAGAEPSVAEQLIAALRQMPAVRTGAQRLLRFGQVAGQRRMNERLVAARRVRIFESLYVPRPLQERDYAVAALSQANVVLADASEPRLAAEVLNASMQALYEPGKEIEVVLAESVLRWQAVDEAVMHAQLERILKAISLPALTLRILPLDRPLSVHPSPSFVLYDDAGFLDSLEEGAEMSGASLHHHVNLMHRLQNASVGVTATKAAVRGAMNRLAFGCS